MGVVFKGHPSPLRLCRLAQGGHPQDPCLFRKRVYVRKLARDILLQKQTFAETIKSLAIASCCEEVWRLDPDPLGYLDNEDVREQILYFLGHENTLALNEALDQSYEIVKKFAGNIGGLVPARKVRHVAFAPIPVKHHAYSLTLIAQWLSENCNN
jgi:hypothetical protein